MRECAHGPAGRRELLALVVALRSELAELRAENEKLRGQVRELAAQLGANSRNSSKPPSADGLAKPAPKSLRGKTGRKPGGQPGHPGRTLTQVPDPDEVIVHEPGRCGGCGADARAERRTVTGRRQVLELPPGQVRVTEHQIVTRRCGCGQVSTGTAPDRVAAPVQYRPRVTALVVYLYVGQFLSTKRTAQALRDLFALPVSEGTVAGTPPAPGPTSALSWPPCRPRSAPPTSRTSMRPGPGPAQPGPPRRLPGVRHHRRCPL